jgi:hypothetical protein
MDETHIKQAFAMGVTDAQNAIAQGPQETFDELVHYYAMKKRGDPRILKHTFGSFKEARAKGEFGEYNILEDDFMRKYTYKLTQN